ncbi:MAG TPA: hypothetical protein VHX62_09805 [Solirubrobacteraceae bacterium]|jgi:hypothetical protein|nr:hypothetical protein [Solirubrobacteraceae bacterium]
MITHTVLFRLKRPVADGALTQLVQGLRAFAQDPPFAVGPAHVDASLGLRGESPRTADALLQVQFPGPEVFDGYLTHERHRALLADVLEPLCEGFWSVQAQS